MAHLVNPLATAEQLYQRSSIDSLPIELQDGIRYHTARLTQAAGILLRLPQDVTARANVLLFRYWLVDDLMQHEFSDVSAATVYLTAKVSASPRSLRSITNVYTYLLTSASAHSSSVSGTSAPDPETYYLSESSYISFRNRLLHIEGQLLNAIGFNTHVALPHPLAITYLQALDVFGASQPGKNAGKEVAKRAIEYLNTALLSPQMLYLTHQPSALATAAIYLAARERDVKLPDSEWWEVFDCDREELGFLVVAMRSLEGLARREAGKWDGKATLTCAAVRAELSKMGGRMGNGSADVVEDEESEIARLLDEKVAAT